MGGRPEFSDRNREPLGDCGIRRGEPQLLRTDHASPMYSMDITNGFSNRVYCYLVLVLYSAAMALLRYACR